MMTPEAQQETQPSRGFWESRVEVFASTSFTLLAKKLNEFYEGKWIVGTQTHFVQETGSMVALVYYKVKA